MSRCLVRVVVAVVMAVVMALSTAACEVVASDPEPSPGAVDLPAVRIGVGPEQESVLLGGVLAELASAAGYAPEVVGLADAGAVRQALEVGDVDVAPGYTGQAWLEDLGRENPPSDPRSSFQGVAAADEQNGILWVRPAFELEDGLEGPPADATLALWVRPEVARQAPSIADLGSLLGGRQEPQVCVDGVFGERADGWQALALRYSIAPTTLVEADANEAVAGVAMEDCLVGLSTLTDGQAWAEGLVPLADPLEVFPAFVVTAQVRAGVVEELPDLPRALEPMARGLTTAMLGRLNARVRSGEDVDEVATAAADQLLDN